MDITYVKAVFGSLRKTTTPPLYRDDHDLVLRLVGIRGIPEYFQAHFANQEYGTAVVMLGHDGDVTIPNTMLSTGLPVYCWVIVENDISGRVIYTVKIPVRQKARPDGTIPHEQADIISQAISALNDAGANAQEAADSAAQSAADAANSAEDANADAQTASDAKTYVTEQAGIIAGTRNYIEQNVVGFEDKVSAAISDVEETGAAQKNLAKAQAENSEAWAVGNRNGSAVPSTDPAYHNNAKYYAEQAAESARTLTTDTTLSQAGQAADAKVVGDKISDIKEDLTHNTENIIGIIKAFVSGAGVTDWVKGSISAHGALTQEECPTVFSDRLKVNAGDIAVVACDPSVEYKVVYYSSYTTQYNTWVKNSGEFTSEPMSIDDGYTIRLVARYKATPDTNITDPAPFLTLITASSFNVAGIKPVVDNFATKNDVESVSDTVDSVLDFSTCKETIGTKTLSINASNGKMSSNNSCRTVYIPCKPNTTYKVNKTAGGRFAVGCGQSVPANNGVLSKYTGDNTASEIIFTTDSTAKYLTAFVYYESTDSPTTAIDMVESVRISVLSAQVYDPNKFDLFVLNRSMYAKTNIPFFAYGDGNARLSEHALQSVIKDGDDLICFVSDTGAVIVRNVHGIYTVYDVPDFDHVMSAELIEPGKYLVSSADANYGTASEKRMVYYYDLATNTITDSFEPTVDGNLVFASQIDSDNFYLITWISSSNNLHFYRYVRSTDIATEIGSGMTIDRTYLQGGCRVNNLLYLSVNDGWNSQTDALIKVVDKDTLEVVDTITMKGFVEVEGFDVKSECENVYAYFGDGKIHRLFCAKLR